ncbi:GlxA family transcriptional regulator [Gordonia sp. ABSL49_1]|uniref:GlxA family transcriptional regulator n=1 Tax=unclassified Gordonia (in: high G+C Gram-positive bacteria) TaxID=2657482 RepID=UPI001F0D56DC|nr:helix-turn-helix domain-containing protein [Gordonia sp. ABSL49_1]MCH5642999.1 helix-turn-helix domain-containing protein [Gordonia sp. ABSL49_1]
MSEDHANSRRHSVVVLLVPPVVGFDATIPPLIFGQATDDAGRRLYDVTLASLGSEPLPTTSGYGLVADAGVGAVSSADTLIVPGTRLSTARRNGRLPDDLADALRSVRPGARIVSICTGAFVLAAAGLFDGRRATTHWRYADDFRRLFPRVDLDESVLFIDDGDVLSSAGLAAGIDLCLHMIRRDHGVAVANRVARHCVVPPWREGGQAQFIDRHVPETDDSTAAVRGWAMSNLTANLSVPALAAVAQMSPRTFSRRFRAETGKSPGAWVLERRVDHARELLESGDLSVDAVAELSGLGTADTLRHHLRRELGMSPSAYRRTFAGGGGPDVAFSPTSHLGRWG